MTVHVVRPGEGEPAGAVRIIEDGSHTGGRLGLIGATLPAGAGGPLEHVHAEHDEVFIVTAGRLRFTSGTESFEAGAGTVVVVPPGTMVPTTEDMS